MKNLLRLCFLVTFILCTNNLFAQPGASTDRYLGSKPNLNIINAGSDGISAPTDLKFCSVPSRKNELWVVNYGDQQNGSTMTIYYDTRTSKQWSENRHDVYAYHFMVFTTALAWGSADSAYFATIGEALNSNGDVTSTFMGPVLWDSDTTKFARIHQDDQMLGSHIDMIHESPYSMGIAFDTLNRYWVFDGYHGCLYHYDFNKSHGWGNDNHDDGKVLKYKEVKLKRIPNLPSHMIVDQSTGWLYIVDNGNKRIIRVATKSGKLGANLTPPEEYLEQYQEMTGVKYETIDSGYSNLSGIAYFEGRLIVSNNGTGDILVYNTTTSPKPTLIGTIKTGDGGITGMTIGPDSAIWYVNSEKSTVIRLTPGAAASVNEGSLSSSKIIINEIYPNPSSVNSTISFTLSEPLHIRAAVYDQLGREITVLANENFEIGKHDLVINASELASGTYYYQFITSEGVILKPFIVKK